MWARSFGATLLVAACAAPAGDELAVSVRITGALTRQGTYAHAADARHLCRSYQPSGPLPTFWEVSFNDDRSPPEDSFTLRFPVMPNMRAAPPFAVIRLTAGGRVWRFQRAPDEEPRPEVQPADDLLTGRFRIRDLRPDDGGEDRIEVEGSWICPPPR